MEAHTPQIALPIRRENKCGYFNIVDANGILVADDGTAGDEYPPSMTPEFADFIVRAVNAHDDLVAALQAALLNVDWYEFDYRVDTGQQIRNALAKAQGTKE